MIEQNTYPVMIIDPPWGQSKGGLRSVRPNQGKELDYSTMSTVDIFMLLKQKIFPLATGQHTLFVWTIEKYLRECDFWMESKFGYQRHVRLIWDKENGIAPAFSIRYSHEYLIWYYKPKFTPVAKEQRGKYTSVFRAPGREHSRKPDIAYQIIDSLFPGVPKLDVFAREKRLNWDTWGNQTDFFQE